MVILILDGIGRTAAVYESINGGGQAFRDESFIENMSLES